MAGIRVSYDFARSGDTNISASIKARFAAMGIRVRDVVYAMADDGKDLAQLYILSRPARTSEGPGRTRTYNMHDSVSVKRYSSQNYVHATFGWFNADEYFTHQEQGFNHRNGVWVPGMYAVTEAIEATLEAVEGAVRAVAKP